MTTTNFYLKYNSQADKELAENLAKSLAQLKEALASARKGSKRAAEIQNDIDFCKSNMPRQGFDEDAAVEWLKSELTKKNDTYIQKRQDMIGRMTLSNASDAITWMSFDLVKYEFYARIEARIMPLVEALWAKSGDDPMTVEMFRTALDMIKDDTKDRLLRNEWRASSTSVFHNAVEDATREAASDVVGNFSPFDYLSGMIDIMIEDKKSRQPWTGWTE